MATIVEPEHKRAEITPEQKDAPSAIQPGEVILGTIARLDDSGRALVEFHGNPVGKPLPAVSTLSIAPLHVGRQVALLFSNGDLSQPIIMGLIRSPLQDMLENYELTPFQNEPPDPAREHPARDEAVTVDGKRLVLEGQEEIVLKCGEASITLTRAGKILIRGKYLLNRSTGVNRIMGGSVQVN